MWSHSDSGGDNHFTSILMSRYIWAEELIETGEVLPAAIPYCEAATSSHEGASSATATPSSDTASEAPSTTDAADADADADDEGDDSADAGEEDDASSEEDEDSSSAKAVPALFGMVAVAAGAAFQVWA